MSTEKNVASSVRHKLLTLARNTQRPFQELLQYYAMERFLYRLSKSAHAQKYILKGALMLRGLNEPEMRPTKDIDFLGKTSNKEDNIVSHIKAILSVPVEVPDGIVFYPDTLKIETITEKNTYEGLRVLFTAELSKARVQMQIDIGFGDVIYPHPSTLHFPTLLDTEKPILSSYTKESLIAEKFEAMISLGTLNSRMKDIYDMCYLIGRFTFDFSVITEAIARTFDNRNTQVHSSPECFSQDYIEEKQVQWKAFVRKLGREDIPQDIEPIVSRLHQFFIPIIDSIPSDEYEHSITRWTPEGGWTR